MHINVDDRLPTIQKTDDSGHRKFYTTEPSRAGAHWVPLMEKAYSKMMQNYERINGGNPEHALRHLSGLPIYHIDYMAETGFAEI